MHRLLAQTVKLHVHVISTLALQHYLQASSELDHTSDSAEDPMGDQGNQRHLHYTFELVKLCLGVLAGSYAGHFFTSRLVMPFRAHPADHQWLTMTEAHLKYHDAVYQT